MRIVAVYREYSDHAREVTEWIDQFERRSGRTVEQLDPDSPEGESFCSAREIMEYPTITVTDDDGRPYNIWSGSPLPVIDEVMSYVAR